MKKNVWKNDRKKIKIVSIIEQIETISAFVNNDK